MEDDNEPHFLLSAFCAYLVWKQRSNIPLPAGEKIRKFQKRLKEKGLAEEMTKKDRERKNKKHQSLAPGQFKVQREKEKMNQGQRRNKSRSIHEDHNNEPSCSQKTVLTNHQLY
jgi:hypothetical protein